MVSSVPSARWTRMFMVVPLQDLDRVRCWSAGTLCVRPHAKYHVPASTASLVEGRRTFLKDPAPADAAPSSARMGAQVMSATAGMTKPTGWHYHVCDGQFVYVLKGWVDLEFEDGQNLRVQDGESLYIPGGLRHNETATSETFEVLEVSVPADMGTVACEAPQGR